ncbi:MAG: tRNA uridine-5-carboxymethylaminomethyl(34) synthesis GTPase MnmE [Methylococcales bacterium]|jgi:tRNA modification GTPase|nr:tRNA uridine-5-carboxymethylaminomethyl(34) synthesis GTPase MnmE [Methylococcales bacterium]MCS5566303.1 tRNA uridine-5-carboxymethylaminomethyl(34) synthesis GTPase MnmE [Methylococcales bacterium]MEE2767282.1 tRNA uridine-5-carboxymethylaminomethyl(34) synthesis GTPase MnmE [Pseudomonadota bacterium]
MLAPACSEPIAAIATPAGKGGIGIVRISGSGIESFCTAILGRVPEPRFATFASFIDSRGRAIDEGIALYFPSPASFTGEDTLELQAHGGRVILDLLMARVLELGARVARPGEFSERAFLNGKIDLLQAEAIADLIEATTVQAARSARNAMQGRFSAKVNDLVEELTELRLYIEASIDFSDEDIDFLADPSLLIRAVQIEHSIQEVLSTARQGCLLREGLSVVIAGKPNTGKSSLLNELTGREVAIVTSEAGTTRDVLREAIEIDGMPLHVIDTAGLRKSCDRVEEEGIRRAREELGHADRILLMLDARSPESDSVLEDSLPPDIEITRVVNKIDLTGEAARLDQTERGATIHLSVKTGDGLDLLYRHLKDVMGYDERSEDVFIARRRHLDALDRSLFSIRQAITRLRGALELELVAEELRIAQQSLSEITGEVTTDDLLGRIFSSFCVGK